MTADRDELKRAAALRAIEEVEDGMVLGLGTGSTAAHVVEGLAARVRAGLRIVGIPEFGAHRARRLVGSAFRLRPSPNIRSST